MGRLEFMDAAQKIRAAVSEVDQLRQVGALAPGLDSSIAAVKRIQSIRFSGTYFDLLAGGKYAAAARFFLKELYSGKDYAERDAQFSRVAGAMQRFFPQDVAATAVALAQLHSLTESLDYAMGQAWLEAEGQHRFESAHYLTAWRSVGRRPEREGQLSRVMEIGEEMSRLTRTPGLRMMLKMMRVPAAAAGLSSLQRFLEAGFDTFAGMARQRNGVEDFLKTIWTRESELIASLFDSDFMACETQLQATLDAGRISN